MSIATVTTDCSVMITGVGGQGILLAGDVLATVALEADLDVKKSEIRGLSRRFGSVWCQVHFGTKVHSPVHGLGAIDLLVSLEIQEGLRRLPYLKQGEVALINRLWIDGKGTAQSAPPAGFDELKYSGCTFLDGSTFTKQTAQTQSLNFFMLGAMSRLLPFDDSAWLNAIETVVKPRFLVANQEMFAAGSQAMLGTQSLPRRPR